MVSVIVPVYNGEKYLRECIDSICNQSYTDLEIIIINDGSNDNTSKIAKQIESKDNRVIYVEHENKGVSYSRNKGLDLATGEYIVFVDCDDTIEKGYIELLFNQISKNNLDIVSCGYTDISIYGTIKLNDFYIGNSMLNKDEFINNIFKGVGGTLWGKIFKTEIINKNKIRLNNNIFMCEDMLFVLQYSMQSKSFGAIEQSLYNYNRKNENSISSKINFEYFDNLIKVMKSIEVILNENKYDKNFIDSILCERIRSLTISFSIMQHDKNHKYSRNEKMNNIIYIFKNQYFKTYKELFKGNNRSENTLINLIKNEDVKKLYYYSYYIFYINKIKTNIRKLIGNGE
ncbi:glycosyltransferase family 2 protein [Clostridium disporicum]|uniref:glycosyltransferase family 2 protein n=1 Tax=Clostridium disporicum TaxID=84024 RepID=UPI00360B8FDA